MDGDLISREAAVGIIMKYCPDDDGSCSKADVDLREMLDEIEDIPAVDATPVVHGRWVHTTKEDDDWGGTFHRFTCSACDWSMGDNPDGWGNYCPNCGAKMDLEE